MIDLLVPVGERHPIEPDLSTRFADGSECRTMQENASILSRF